MGVFLGLGDAQLGQPGAREHFAETVLQIFAAGTGRQQERVRSAEYSVMPRAAENRGRRPRSKPLKSGIEERGQNFAHPVGAEIGHEKPVAVLHATITGDRRGLDELVGLAACISRATAASALAASSPLPSTSMA